MTNLQKYECPICHKDMTIDYMITLNNKKNGFIDYFCNQDDHGFAQRIRDENLSKMRVRFSNDKERLVLRVHYDEGYSEVWSKVSFSVEDKIRLNQIVPTNFNDIEALKNKIRIILVFS